MIRADGAAGCLGRQGRSPIPPDLTSPQILPKNFLRACLLLLLREHPAHGYDLLERLRPLGFSREDPGRLYRALRALENDGLVSSGWEKSTSGPDRRMYELTRSGVEVLHESAKALSTTGEILGVFLDRYAEFVALDPEAGKRSRARHA
jgi:poly-beta-hydroxybutyrate-responsive repressor